MHVVVHNLTKRHNIDTLSRSVTPFSVSELILVGRREFNAFGSHGSTPHLCFHHFHSLQDAHLFFKERDCDICGVEITDDALPVNHHPFTKSTAFVLGNEDEKSLNIVSSKCYACTSLTVKEIMKEIMKMKIG